MEIFPYCYLKSHYNGKFALSTSIDHISTSIESRELPTILSFDKEIIGGGKPVIPSQPVVTENGNLVYAICDQTDYHSSTKKYCNITIELSPFSNVSRTNDCLVSIAPDEPNYQTLSRFTMLSYTDNKVILFWMQEDNRFSSKSIIFKILKMSTCKLINVTMPTNQLSYVVVYDNKLDLILSNQKFCSTPSCKISLNGNGKRIYFNPIKILKDVDVAFQYSLGPVSRDFPERGFFASVILKNEENFEKLYAHLFRVWPDGRATVFGKFSIDNYVSFSNSHEYFSLCESAEDTNIKCRQYDATLKLKVSANFEFEDNGLNRCIQPYNLEDGSLLLITGVASKIEGRHYKNFYLIKVDPDGRRDRPLVVEGLELKCKRSENLRIHVVENEWDNICIYFVCRHGGEYQRKLKFSTKCLPKTIFTMVKRRPAIIS